MNELRAKIGAAQRRMTINAAVDALATALLLGACAAALVVFADRLFHLEIPLFEAGLWILAASTIAAAALALLKIPSPFAAALLLDDKARMRERFSSALLIAREPESPMSAAFLNEAAGRCGAVDVRKAVPIRLPRKFLRLPIPLTICALLLLFMPEADLLGRKALAEERTRKEKEIETLVARPLMKKAEKLERIAQERNMKQIPPVVKQIEKAAKQVQQESLEKKDALARISGLIDEGKKKTEEMKERQSRMSDALRAINKEMGDPKEKTQLFKDLADGKWEEAIKDLEKMKEEMKEGKLSEEKLEKLKEEIRGLAEKLDKIDEKDLKDLEQALTPEDLKALEGIEGALDKLAEGLEGKDLNKLLENLKQFEGELGDLADLGELELTEMALGDLEDLKWDMLHEMNGCPDGSG